MFGILHAESSAVVAAVGCLVAGVGSVGPLRRLRLAEVARAHVAALAVPFALLTASLLWRPNCAWATGAGLFVVLVPPSVLFGLAVAYAVTGMRLRAPRATVAIVLLGVAVGGAAWTLLRHPQFFVYNPVFGGVLGPIYDEELAIRPGLFAARAQTVVMAAALLAYGAWRRGGGRRAAVAGGASLVALGGSVLLAPELGIVQTEAGLRTALSATVERPGLRLHVAPETSAAERRRLADEAAFRLHAVTASLGVRPSATVEVFLYPDADTKAALVGSRTTSVVPVWLRTPQVHMLASEVPRSLAHELVHVVAREFGAPVLRASPAIGLVEGLAVALEPPDGLPPPADLVRAGAVVQPDFLGDPAEAVRETMSPGGFWSSRAGVAYTANGAFARWLLDAFGPAPMREAYRTGRFERAYGRSLGALAESWGADLAARPLDPEALAVAEWQFSRPSLFEVRCPHHVPPAVRAAREGDQAWERGNAGDAWRAFSLAVEADSLYLPGLRGALSVGLAAEQIEPATAVRLARARVDTLADAAGLVHLGDALAVAGDPAGAAQAYRAASDALPPVDAVGRLLVRRRTALAPDDLRAWLGVPPDSVPAGLAERAPVLAALRHAAADRPDEAWRIASDWPVRRLVAGLDSAGAAEAQRVLRLLGASLAVRAGALGAADAQLDGLAAAFSDAGPRALAAVVEDLGSRVEWTRARRPRASILPDPSRSPLDARSPPARPADPRGRVRGPGGSL